MLHTKLSIKTICLRNADTSLYSLGNVKIQSQGNTLQSSLLLILPLANSKPMGLSRPSLTSKFYNIKFGETHDLKAQLKYEKCECFVFVVISYKIYNGWNRTYYMFQNSLRLSVLLVRTVSV